MRASGVVDIGADSLTQVSEVTWRKRPAGYRAWERSTDIGAGEQFWNWATVEVLRWGVKTRSGFTRASETSPGRAVYPLLLAAQVLARRRYLDALLRLAH